MLRVVIDPNVFVSAVITPDGVPAQVVRAVLAREFQLVVSPMLIGELGDVLSRPKLRRYIDGEQAQTLLDSILGVSQVLGDPEPGGGTSVRDPDDTYLASPADGARADMLVSGDKDLLDARLQVAAVVSPAVFLQHLRA